MTATNRNQGDLAFGWTILRNSDKPVQPGQLRCRGLGLTVDGRELLQALTAQGHAALLVPFDPREASPRFAVLDSVKIEVRGYAGPPTNGSYVFVECLEEMLDEVFGEFCESVMLRLRRGEGATAAISTSLRDFRRLLHAPTEERIARELVVGLYGELVVLETLQLRSSDAVRTWHGPKPALQDFRNGNLAVEVKTTLEGQGRRVHVSGLAQLEPPAAGELSLVFCRLRHDPNGRALGMLMMDICAHSADPESIERKAALVLDGASPQAAGDELRFAVAEVEWYLVSPGFPRIVRSSLQSDGNYAGVDEVKYSLDLSAAKAHLMNGAQIEDFTNRLLP